MMFEYDSWNRVQRIVYPDSEVVSYGYDLGGQLCRVHTYKSGHRDTLIKNILYDEFGHRTQVVFGNSVTTNYTYDNLQRLSGLQTFSNNANLQKILYSFDLEDNITKVINTAGGANGLGGAYTFDYQYDNLYRLTSSTGSFTPTGDSYFLEMGFTPAGRVCRKEQGDPNATRRLLYSYNPHNAPHATRRIYDPSTTNLRQMLWDANGNIAQIAEYLYDATNEIVNLQDFRNHYWDEDDRLNLILDNSHFSYYLYGCDGQRVAKLTGSAFTLGTGFATNAMLDNYTLYPSEYLVITQQGYTKYYYAGGTRIASKLGSGGFEKMTRLCTLDQNLTANANTLFNSVVARIGEDMPQGYISDPCPNYYSDIAGFRVQLPTLNFEPNFGITAQQNILQVFRQNYANEETYYFHGNHLGSANWITTATASPTQFLLHLPYGEEFVKQLSGSYDERFTFTGKEKDIETGYYYFGARFDNVDLGFMSVDPISNKYPSISPYAYCAWNPVKLVDPNGRDCKISIDNKAKTIIISANIIIYSRNISENKLKGIASQYQKDILKTWSKDENGKKWTYKGYIVEFDIGVSADNKAFYSHKRNYKNGINNYIEIIENSQKRSYVKSNMHDGVWNTPSSDHNPALHEFGHLLGLKDQYIEYTETINGRKVVKSKPIDGWEGNIMAEYKNGKVNQKNINSIFKNRSIKDLNNWIKKASDYEK